MASSRVLVSFFLLWLCCSAYSPALSAAAAAAGEKVQLALYYETLCPYCSRFIVNYLSKIFHTGLISIVDLELVPYGNARIGSNDTITCQHGPYECVLNTVEACAISAWPDVHEHFKFIYCVEQLVMKHKYTEWETCFKETGLDSKSVLDCYANGHGKEIELEYAAQTNALQPPHKYVPWVTVNGHPLYDGYQKFEAEVCKAYKGDLPKPCEELLLMTTPQMKANKADPVCFADEVTGSSILIASST